MKIRIGNGKGFELDLKTLITLLTIGAGAIGLWYRVGTMEEKISDVVTKEIFELRLQNTLLQVNTELDGLRRQIAATHPGNYAPVDIGPPRRAPKEGEEP